MLSEKLASAAQKWKRRSDKKWRLVSDEECQFTVVEIPTCLQREFRVSLLKGMDGKRAAEGSDGFRE